MIYKIKELNLTTTARALFYFKILYLYIPCTISVATALSVFIVDPVALQSISVLLYSDDTVTVRFLLVVRLPTSSAPSWVNPLLFTLCANATVLFTLYVIVSVLFAVQVNSTVVPSTAATETGLTRKT